MRYGFFCNIFTVKSNNHFVLKQIFTSILSGISLLQLLLVQKTSILKASVYRTEESLKPPQLPKSSKAIEKERKRTLKPPIISKVTHVRILQKCDECSKPRCIFSRHALNEKLSRKLEISELQNFHCGVDLHKAINDEELSKKMILLTAVKFVSPPSRTQFTERNKQTCTCVAGAPMT